MGEQRKEEAELKRQGWQFASTTGGEHLKRTLEMYDELGIETYLIKLEPEKCGDCTKCYELGDEAIYMVYIKGLKNDDSVMS